MNVPNSLEAFGAALASLDAFHGLATGMFSGDEWLAGNAPEHGVELCAVVEFLHSLAEGFRVGRTTRSTWFLTAVRESALLNFLRC
jgi:hypothetical protein